MLFFVYLAIKEKYESHKRKRDGQSMQKSLHSSTKSMSQLSISQEAVPKKTKRATVETMSSNTDIVSQINSQNYTLYKLSKYLKMPRRLLLYSLHLQLNCPLKKKKEQRFVLSRLKIVDQQFCLERIRYLYQTYLDLGSQQKVSFQGCYSPNYTIKGSNLISSRNIWQITCYYHKTKSIDSKLN